MNPYKMFCLFILLASISGCAGLTQTDRNVQREFTFDFVVPGKPKLDIWKNARDYFAEVYGDSRAVFRVMDENDGTIIGRGTAQWALVSSTCLAEYHVRFAAKDEKARLQFELIEGAPPQSPCSGWSWPTKEGYDQIVFSFKNAARDLEKILASGGSVDQLKDF